MLMFSTTYARLDDGSWGLRTPLGTPAGTTVRVRRRDGSEREEVVGPLIRSERESELHYVGRSSAPAAKDGSKPKRRARTPAEKGLTYGDVASERDVYHVTRGPHEWPPGPSIVGRIYLAGADAPAVSGVMVQVHGARAWWVGDAQAKQEGRPGRGWYVTEHLRLAPSGARPSGPTDDARSLARDELLHRSRRTCTAEPGAQPFEDAGQERWEIATGHTVAILHDGTVQWVRDTAGKLSHGISLDAGRVRELVELAGLTRLPDGRQRQ